MAKLAWDRILETCLKRKLSAHLVVGWPVVFGEGPTRREGMVPPITFEEFSSMLQEIMPLENEIQETAWGADVHCEVWQRIRLLFRGARQPGADLCDHHSTVVITNATAAVAVAAWRAD
jgi:hypothetical protein